MQHPLTGTVAETALVLCSIRGFRIHYVRYSTNIGRGGTYTTNLSGQRCLCFVLP